MEYHRLLQTAKHHAAWLPGIAVVRASWRDPLPHAEWIDGYSGRLSDGFKRAAAGMCRRLEGLPAESQYLVVRHLVHRAGKAAARGGGEKKRRLLLLVLAYRQCVVPDGELHALLEDAAAASRSAALRSDLHFVLAVLSDRRGLDHRASADHLSQSIVEAERSGDRSCLAAAFYRAIRRCAVNHPDAAREYLDDALDVLHDERWMDLLGCISEHAGRHGLDYSEEMGMVVRFFADRFAGGAWRPMGAVVINLFAYAISHAAMLREYGYPGDSEEMLDSVMTIVADRPEVLEHAVANVVLSPPDPRRLYWAFLLECLLASAENRRMIKGEGAYVRRLAQAARLAERSGYDFGERIARFSTRP